jgi:GNAT superfamily N-acetyltransferase
MSDLTIARLDENAARTAMPRLVDILRDSVDGGASVGFLPPLGDAEAAEYWQGVVKAIAEGSRVLLVAHESDRVVGTAQLDLCTRPNGRHRAEVMKVMVLRAARRRGIGRALMLALDGQARRLGRTTLVLDTRRGDPSEQLYASTGWTLVGAIPDYAESAGGVRDASAFYYRLLDS